MPRPEEKNKEREIALSDQKFKKYLSRSNTVITRQPVNRSLAQMFLTEKEKEFKLN
jgi:hypothetical protein